MACPQCQARGPLFRLGQDKKLKKSITCCAWSAVNRRPPTSIPGVTEWHSDKVEMETYTTALIVIKRCQLVTGRWVRNLKLYGSRNMRYRQLWFHIGGILMARGRKGAIFAWNGPFPVGAYIWCQGEVGTGMSWPEARAHWHAALITIVTTWWLLLPRNCW